MKFVVVVLLAMLHLSVNASSEEETDDSDYEDTTEDKNLNIFQKSRCIIPNGVDHVSRAILLQQCLSEDYAQGNETNCYEELGCFLMDSPWTSLLRPFPTPKSPSFIDMHLYLYTRSVNSGYDVPLWPEVNLAYSDFNPNRLKTIFIIHGFASSANNTWLSELKDAYLQNVDANVFIVDWGKGAKSANYLQVASNTRIVGAELARFIRNATNVFGLHPRDVHLIGHSLGAQISAYCAKRVRNIGRLTALDPAQPGFEGTPAQVRLALGDAKFIEVVHTSARPFVPTLGFGMISAVGNVDFYMNGGLLQPGCALPKISGFPPITSINDLAKIPVEVLAEWIACSHGRSYEFYIAALTSNCTFWGRKSRIVRQAFGSPTLDAFGPVVSSLTSCSSNTCLPLNLETPLYKARGIFSLATKSEAPYCSYNPKSDKKILSEIFGSKADNSKNIISGLENTISKISPLGRSS